MVDILDKPSDVTIPLGSSLLVRVGYLVVSLVPLINLNHTSLYYYIVYVLVRVVLYRTCTSTSGTLSSCTSTSGTIYRIYCLKFTLKY